MCKIIIQKPYKAISRRKEDEWKSKFEFAIKSFDASIWEYDLEKNLFFTNSMDSVICGGENCKEYISIHPNDKSVLKTAFEELTSGKRERLQIDVRVRQQDDSYTWIRIHGAVFERTKKGVVRRVIGLRRDIEEQMREKTELLESKRKLEEYAIKASLSLNSGEVFIWDYNVTAERFSSHTITSYMYGGVSKSDFIESVHIDDREIVFEGLRKFLIEGSTETYTCKIRINIPEKGLRWVELTATVLSRDSYGKPLALTGLKRDVTKEHDMMEELVELRNKAEEANNLKTAFFANMSHEIRTPLNAILGFSNLIVESTGDEALAEYAKVIVANNELLMQLVNDVLNLSRIEAGKLEFRMSKICVSELMNQLKQTFLLRAQNNVDVIFDTPTNQCYIISEHNRLTQVLTNFLGNAVKYTSKGAIHLGYEQRPAGLYFYVTDTGKGIVAENVPLVFNRFTKFDNSVQGTGLGLSICKMIVDRLGGEIGAESELGKGSKFWFTLPCEVTTF